MAWKRFPVPAFDHGALKKMTYDPPSTVEGSEASRIVDAASSGDESVAGGYAVMADPALLESLSFKGDHRDMILCALPKAGTHLLARSYAWYNQRAFLLGSNEAGAETIHSWRTPRPMNTRFGPEEGVTLDRNAVFILSGRILSDHTRGNRVMIDNDWTPGEGRQGFRVIAACDEGENDFHDACFEFSWQA